MIASTRPFIAWGRRPMSRSARVKVGIVVSLAGLALPWLALASDQYSPLLGVLGNMMRSPIVLVGSIVCIAVGIGLLLFTQIEAARLRVAVVLTLAGCALPLISLPYRQYVPRAGLMWLLLQNRSVFVIGILCLLAGLGVVLF